MKIKLSVSKDLYPLLLEKLSAGGFEISEDAELILTENKENADYISCKKDGVSHHISAEDILFIESMGHDVIIHTEKDAFKSADRLWQFEKSLSPTDFLRVSNSVIINTKEVKAIRAALSQKFVVTMSDDSKVDVTRSYYYIFKNKFGI